ncbi:hypothetical protein HYPSUDRAFT_722642 [Hypholoma sublateritium FD-334 SS-4]|uniref:Arrestin C-terminal-like domain-containing protein n=1 Tax=Hypholoma sublateritium (strain FD-334 SS-4) TaxID=945553 RepID=A0A0D2PCW7_HYPSF|nr:hypothetical protein HYPSUDRAFT_722642 [Hypholoma sublateritium FD-334 SS-4]
MPTVSTTLGPSSGLAISFSEASSLPTSTASISGSPMHDLALPIQDSVYYAGMSQENDSTAVYSSDDLDESYNTPCYSACLEDTTTSRRSLLEIHGTPGQTAAELKQILGNDHSRLKSGAEISLGTFSEPQRSHISLEQAKSRSRVNLDIFLQSNKQKPVLISRGKIRLIGFESLDDGERSIFYQCSSSLSDVTRGIDRIYASEPDIEGFSTATEGTHFLPFVLYMDPESESGTAKGVLPLQSGLYIRYIAIVSLELKDPSSGARSFAHFYRDCSIWPRLNPSIVLAPTSRPIQVTASESLRMGGNGQVTLTASIHRLHWVSGQSCFVKVKVVNKSDKALKNLCLQLLRSTTVFRTGYEFDAMKGGSKAGAIADILQSSTTKKQVAQSILEVCARGTRGHASAKDALSISRGHLIEVSYEIQVIVNVGTILATEVKVSLPIEIVNFLSFDPPHPALITNPAGTNIQSSDSSPMESEYTEQYSEEESDFEDEPLDQHNDQTEHHRNDIVSENTVANNNKSPPRFADLYYSSLQENLDKAAAQHEQDTAGHGTIYPESRHGNLHSTFAARVKEKYLQRQALLASNAPIGDEEVNYQELDTGRKSSAITLEKQPSTSDSAVSPDSARQSDSVLNNQTTSPSNIDPAERITSKTPFTEPTRSSSQTFQADAERSTISGVSLPNEHIQRPYWKILALARADYLPESNSSTLLPQVTQGLLEEDPIVHVHPSSQTTCDMRSTTNNDTPKKVSSPSAPRAGSVRDKIRELEELVAKVENGV